MRVFISGHLDLTPDEFAQYYIPRLQQAVDSGCSFVVGDAKGADSFAQGWLCFHCPGRTTVYHMFDSPRSNVGESTTVGGFHSDNERDTAMTDSSDTDIAWVRPGREKSGTAKNLARRSHGG